MIYHVTGIPQDRALYLPGDKCENMGIHLWCWSGTIWLKLWASLPGTAKITATSQCPGKEPAVEYYPQMWLPDVWTRFPSHSQGSASWSFLSGSMGLHSLLVQHFPKRNLKADVTPRSLELGCLVIVVTILTQSSYKKTAHGKCGLL
jgi:hypothetical protein